MSDFETDVLIVGCGPTGSTAALALATHGVRVHLISRSNWLANTPRAHITNQRANEVFRDLGLTDDISRYASPWDFMGDMTFATSLAGPELVRLRAWGTGEDRKGDYLRASPCGMVDIIQPLLEPILFNKAAERGATFAFNTEYLKHEQDCEGVRAHLRDRLSGREYRIRARYMIGADGANSAIARDLGLPIEGQMARAGTVYTLFDANLSRYTQHRPSILNWIVSPDASVGEIGLGLLRAVRPWTQWIAGWGIDIADDKSDLSEESVRHKILLLIGDPSVKIKVLKTSIWYVNQAYAAEYSKGRVFCAGDAVHRHPPSSGLGLNTCVQDAFNLAWKLAYVLKGYAGERLLDSYTLERAPIGRQIVERANQSRVDYAALNACFRLAQAENPVAAGIARFHDPGREGAAARRAVQEALDLKQREFNAHGVEMNQRYDSGAVLADDPFSQEVFLRDPELFCQATTRPGAKIPHAWVVGEDGTRLSTLDVTGHGAFTLISGLGGAAWAQAAKSLGAPFLRAVIVGKPGAEDLYCEWQRIREIAEAGALLVRPDGYIAWREPNPVYDHSTAQDRLREAIDSVLARDSPVSEASCLP